MTNSDSRSVSEPGSLAKPARLQEDQASIFVHDILGNGSRDEFWSWCLPVDACLHVCMLLLHTSLCAHYTGTHGVNEKIFLCALCSLCVSLHQEFSLLLLL